MAKKVTFGLEDPLEPKLQEYKDVLDAGDKAVRLDLSLETMCLNSRGALKYMHIPPAYDRFLDWDVDIYKEFESQSFGIALRCPKCKDESIHRDVNINNNEDFPLDCGLFLNGRPCTFSLRYKDREKHCKRLFRWTYSILLVPKGKPIFRFLEEHEKLKKGEKQSVLESGPPTFKKLVPSPTTKTLVDLLGVVSRNDTRSKAMLEDKN